LVGLVICDAVIAACAAEVDGEAPTTERGDEDAGIE